MKILVTGSAGSLGNVLCRKFDARGYNIYGADKNTSEFTNYVIDLTDEYKVEEMFDKLPNPDYVVHCAATIYGVGGFNKNGFDILANDTAMTRNLLNYTGGNTKFVFMSSSMVYENVPKFKGVGFHEDAKETDVEKYPAPRTGYGFSKYMGEQLVREWQRQYGGLYTIWRPFNIITPHEVAKPELGYAHVFADFFQHLVIEQKSVLPIIGDGEQIRCFTWIDEVADCIVDNLTNPDTDNTAFNVANREPVTMKELAFAIHDEAVRRGIRDTQTLDFKTVKEFPLDVKYRVPNVDLARNTLGFEARVKLQESIGYLMDEWENRQ